MVAKPREEVLFMEDCPVYSISINSQNVVVALLLFKLFFSETATARSGSVHIVQRAGTDSDDATLIATDDEQASVQSQCLLPRCTFTADKAKQRETYLAAVTCWQHCVSTARRSDGAQVF